MKPPLWRSTILGIIVAAPATAQTELYSNASASPAVPALGAAVVTASGVAAPAGSMWSEVPAAGALGANAVAGFSAHSAGLTGAYRFADDFTVSDAGGWDIHSFMFYAYQAGASPLSAPFSGINVRVWSGPPEEPGSVVVLGDTATNRLVSSGSPGIYRVFNTVAMPSPAAPDTTRRIWQGEAGMGEAHLDAGTYWVDWQFIATDPMGVISCPPATIPGSRGVMGANARQFKVTGGTTASEWVVVVDPGKPAGAPDVAQEFPFIVRGTVASGCSADFNGDAVVNSQDFFDFLTAFFGQDPSADFNDDGATNSQDFFDFLGAFFVGC